MFPVLRLKDEVTHVTLRLLTIVACIAYLTVSCYPIQCSGLVVHGGGVKHKCCHSY
nr:MAG TPA: hypothetical protein [Caudoviricetes sp.]